MNELKNSLIEVRKAYRLLYDYQKKVLDLVQFIGTEFGRSYKGGYSKYSNVTPRNGKGHLSNWGWDWLNMYYYEFNFHNEENKDFFSVVLISDTGYYEAKDEDENFNDKLEPSLYMKLGVIDKIVAHFRIIFSSGQNSCCFFKSSFIVVFLFFIFDLSN